MWRAAQPPPPSLPVTPPCPALLGSGVLPPPCVIPCATWREHCLGIEDLQHTERMESEAGAGAKG